MWVRNASGVESDGDVGRIEYLVELGLAPCPIVVERFWEPMCACISIREEIDGQYSRHTIDNIPAI